MVEAVHQGVLDTSSSGVVQGYPVVDVRVELRGATVRQDASTPLAFQIAAGQAFRRALENARPVLLEPVMHLEVLVPEEWTGSVIGGLQSRHGVIERIEARGRLQADERPGASRGDVWLYDGLTLGEPGPRYVYDALCALCSDEVGPDRPSARARVPPYAGAVNRRH